MIHAIRPVHLLRRVILPDVTLACFSCWYNDVHKLLLFVGLNASGWPQSHIVKMSKYREITTTAVSTVSESNEFHVGGHSFIMYAPKGGRGVKRHAYANVLLS